MHRLAVTTAAATFALLLVGGVVHGTGSGLACPESSLVPLPLCAGRLAPEMTGHVLYEHGHRLLASGVGLLAIALAAIGLARRRAHPGLAWAAAAAVPWFLVQGVLGRLTVVYFLPPLVSIAHLASSVALFGLLVFIAFESSPAPAVVALSAPLRRLVGVATAVVFLQIALGAMVRHFAAGIACLDFPLCDGRLWPLGGSRATQIHMLHRFGAMAAVLVVVALAFTVRRAGASRGARRLAHGAVLLVATQAVLGYLSLRSLLGLWQVTAHLGVGVLLFADLWLLFLATHRESAELAAAPRPSAIIAFPREAGR